MSWPSALVTLGVLGLIGWCMYLFGIYILAGIAVFLGFLAIIMLWILVSG